LHFAEWERRAGGGDCYDCAAGALYKAQSAAMAVSNGGIRTPN